MTIHTSAPQGATKIPADAISVLQPGETALKAIARLRAEMEAEIDRMIDALDALDAPTEDLEGELQAADLGCIDPDREPDDWDEEDDPAELAWRESASQLETMRSVSGASEDEEDTALERHGVGFLPSGGDDREDSHDAEAVDEDGGDIQDEPHDGDDEDREPDADEEEAFGASPEMLAAKRQRWQAGGRYKDPVSEAGRKLRAVQFGNDHREFPHMVDLGNGRLVPVVGSAR